MLIGDKTRGRDSMIDPYYLARDRFASYDDEIQHLEEEINRLKIELAQHISDYERLSGQVDAQGEEINSLSTRISELEGQISEINLRIQELQDEIDSMDQYEPIDSSFIDNLPPYNEQEGVG